MTRAADVLVVGGGIAGAAAGYFLAGDGLDVALLERESQPGYHATGRSAALFSELYGPPLIRRLATASRPMLDDPPDGFCERPLLSPRGLLELGTAHQLARIEAVVEAGRANGATVERLDEAALCAAVPILRPGRFAAGAFEPGAMDLDVAALHQAFLRGFRRAGGTLHTDAEAATIERVGGNWRLRTRRGETFEATVLVNAAGAWADEVGGLAGVPALGLVPCRRTAVMIDLPAGTDPGRWPLTGDLAESFYFKPAAGRLMLSPADAAPVAPQDVQPEIEDVATVIERFMEVTTVAVERPRETWAGLRSFVADGDPVAGYAPAAEGFFWLAGQGGYGIQTAAALGALAAALVQGREPPAAMTRLGLDVAALSPARPSLAATPRTSGSTV